MPQFPAVIELSSLDGNNGFKINGEAAFDLSGWSVSSAGDMNGDGFADLLVGAWSADPHGDSSGSSYVVFGKHSGFGATLELSSLDGHNGFQINGVARYDDSGLPVSSAGDVNGDGFDDVIVGAYQADPNHKSGAGASYVVFGKGSGFSATLELSSLDGNNGFQINGVARDDHSGLSAHSAGDINGDGFGDLVIGANDADPNGYSSGTAYVVFGKSGGFGPALNLSDLDGNNGFALNGVAEGDHAGRSVASAGDVNGDGFDDLIVGAHGTDRNGYYNLGTTYVVFGKASAFDATLELSALDGVNGFAINGVANYDRSGFTISAAGDVNGDGFADIAVGAWGAYSQAGASYIVFGTDSGFGATLELSALDGNNGFQVKGEAAGNYSGYSVTSAGDVNGDGFDDVIVGARGNSPHGFQSGAAYVMFGKADGFDATLELSDLDGTNGFRLNGAAVKDYTGGWVSSAGDINGDGFADLIVGAHGADPNGSNSGVSYVVFGIAPDEAVHRVGTDASQTLAGGDFDDKLKGLGGNDNLFGNGGGDKLRGGHGNDVLKGGLGGDGLKGGGGADVFVYGEANESTSANYDTILHANLAHSDAFDLTFHVTDVDTALASGALSTASFDTDLAAAVDAAHLGQDHAVLFTPDGGTLAGEVFLVIDANNTAGYQAGEDIVMHLEDATNLARLDVTDFI